MLASHFGRHLASSILSTPVYGCTRNWKRVKIEYYKNVYL